MVKRKRADGKKADTKSRMVSTTIALLELQGYHATGLNQIIQESSTPKGSIYFHFPGGKEDLVMEAVLSAGESVRLKVLHALNSNEDLGKAIKEFILTISCELEKSDFRKGCPVAAVAVEVSATHDKLRAACEKVYESWFLLVKERFLKAGLDIESAESWTTLVWSAIEGSLILSRNQRSTRPLNIVANQFEVLISKPRILESF
jgi:TetR/AcrR family transcriptional repressor of lmrAB and yxaGH operons